MKNTVHNPDDLGYDPDAVKISHAATVMLIDDRVGSHGTEPELHVLMLRRNAKVVFGPDNWVFPGGRVDPEDHIDDFDRLCVGLSDHEASQILDIERGGLAWWIAACRETLEEAGLLLADGLAPHVDLDELRERVRENESVFVDELLERNITLDVSTIEEVARFITPHGPPRRFDARFFVAQAPTDQLPHFDDGEIVNLAWMRPDDALGAWRAGDMTMMSPTVRMVECLGRFRSVPELMETARRRLDYQRVRVVDPNGQYRVVLPGEPGYETAELEVESGWVRLWQTPEVGI